MPLCRGGRYIVGLFTVLWVTAALFGALAQEAAEATALYTEEQAGRGEQTYGQNCSQCHGSELDGSPNAPPLRGPGFLSAWGERTVAELYEYTQANMPLNNPGSLSDQQYADVIALILQANGHPAGEEELMAGGEALGQVTLAQGAAPAQAQPEQEAEEEAAEEAEEPVTQTRAELPQAWEPVTDEFLNNPPDGAWPSLRRTLNAWNYSPLEQINQDNVAELELVWAFDTGTTGGVEWTPYVVNGVMFVYGNSRSVHALDAATGDLIWDYQRQLPADFSGLNLSRGLTIYEDKVIINTADSKIIALDAQTGQQLWETDTEGGGYTSPGIIANGVLVSGARAPNYDRAFVTGTDVETGETLWQTYVIPEAGEPGYDTWEVEGTAEVGHGSVWMTPSYDPELNLVYVNTGNPDPYTHQTRPGDNLYVDSTLALNPETGELVWYYQYIPNDSWDQDQSMDSILVDLEIDGEERQALVHMGKTGNFYVLDRTNGEFIHATTTTYQNIIESIDPETGRPTMNYDLAPNPEERVVFCPSTIGGTDWPARTYSPQTGLVYFSGNNVCADTLGVAFEMGRDQPMRNIRDELVIAPGVDSLGEVWALDPTTLEQVWKVEYDIPWSGPLMSTGGGLVFGGGVDRYFRAFDAMTGEELWRQRLASPIDGHPISYEIDGVQYIAVPAGCCGLVSARMSRDLAPETVVPPGTGIVYVFALRDQVE